MRRCLVLILAIGIVPFGLSGCDWAQPRFGPDHGNVNPSEPALTETSVQHLKVAWSVPCSCSQPLVAKGLVYTTDTRRVGNVYDSTLRVFDASTGTPKWSVDFGATAVVAAVANGLVYVTINHATTEGVTADGELRALEATTGAAWFTLTPPRSGAGVLIVDAVVDGSLAVVTSSAGDNDTRISAVTTGGRVVWSTTPGGRDGSVFVDPGRTVYEDSSFLTPNGDQPLLTELNESDGTVLRTVLPQIGHAKGVFAAANGLVYGSNASAFGGLGIGAFAVHPETGALAWNRGYGFIAVDSRVAIVAGVYGSPMLRLDPVSGKQRWSQLPGWLGAGPVVAGNLLYDSEAASFDSGLPTQFVVVRRLSDGSRVASFDVREGIRSLTPSEGHIYAAGATRLYALVPSP